MSPMGVSASALNCLALVPFILQLGVISQNPIKLGFVENREWRHWNCSLESRLTVEEDTNGIQRAPGATGSKRQC